MVEQDVTLIATVAMGVLAALVCGYAARRLHLPVIVGYLVGGVLVGPSTPGFVADDKAAFQFAELGVIFMMFGVGLHFSMRDLSDVKRVAVPGAILQMSVTTALGWLLATRLWGWSNGAALVLGLAISIASTVVLLRGLADRGLLNSPGGKTAIGWLILEDLATVAILVLLPVVVGDDAAGASEIVWALGKAVFFIVVVLLVGVRLLPRLLSLIVRTRSRELFLLAVVSLAAGTAYGAYELFGVSFALGAFLAGVVMGGSTIHHQVEAEVLPFRDIFAVLFFVAVGIQVDLSVVADQFGSVLVIVALVVIGKTLLTLSLSFVMPRSGRELAVVAAGLSQIGEFSFIVGQAGVQLELLTRDQYALIVAAAVVAIMVNPVMFAAVPTFEKVLLGLPFVGRRMRRAEPGAVGEDLDLRDHVVVVGYGRVGRQTVEVLRELDVPMLVVDLDMASIEAAERDGLLALFGDASNSNILDHAGLARARALVVTLPDQTAAETVVITAHRRVPELPIVARAGSLDGVARLAGLGARQVVNPELEGGLEIVGQTLLELRYPLSHVQPFIDAIRRETLQGRVDLRADGPGFGLDQLLTAVEDVNIAWCTLSSTSPFVHHTLGATDLRHSTGASVVAVMRRGELLPNPSADMALEPGDLLGLIGTTGEVSAAERLLATGSVRDQPDS